MPALLQNLLFCTLLQSADSHSSLPLFDAQQAQEWMIHHALSGVSTRVTCGDNGHLADICTWRCIECTDGMATAIFFRKTLFSDNACVELKWLPPTIAFIHLKSTRTPSGLSLHHLPRNLKYLYLLHSSGETPLLDCALLPQRMEELILVESTNARSIRFSEMPTTMRFIYIRQMPSLTKCVIVDYDRLPSALEEIRLTCLFSFRKFNRKIREVGSPRNVKLNTNFDMEYPKKGSKYINIFDAKEQ